MQHVRAVRWTSSDEGVGVSSEIPGSGDGIAHQILTFFMPLDERPDDLDDP